MSITQSGTRCFSMEKKFSGSHRFPIEAIMQICLSPFIQGGGVSRPQLENHSDVKTFLKRTQIVVQINISIKTLRGG